MHHILKVAMLAALMLMASACRSEPTVMLGGERFSVELATTSDEHALGLMFRESMPDDHGMLFIFPTEVTRSFWMKNTRIPLDIFYFDRDLRLVSVAENARPCRVPRCPSYPSDGPARYVLELNAGKAEELGVSAGDRLELDID
ncbi:DUF192 domain-containing protein [Elongatibacter sediminis]|uniref:DUF192 domain-containing protein n=1 Tax=Elongatibacter sediminis TaxID=3119006 RepID=A0AAW9RK88_9GAMM